jgi:hypothetical protein
MAATVLVAATADTQDGGLKYKYDKQTWTAGLLQYFPGAKIQNEPRRTNEPTVALQIGRDF